MRIRVQIDRIWIRTSGKYGSGSDPTERFWIRHPINSSIFSQSIMSKNILFYFLRILVSINCWKSTDPYQIYLGKSVSRNWTGSDQDNRIRCTLVIKIWEGRMGGLGILQVPYLTPTPIIRVFSNKNPENL